MSAALIVITIGFFAFFLYQAVTVLYKYVTRFLRKRAEAIARNQADKDRALAPESAEQSQSHGSASHPPEEKKNEDEEEASASASKSAYNDERSVTGKDDDGKEQDEKDDKSEAE